MTILSDSEFRKLEVELGARRQYVEVTFGRVKFDALRGESILDDKFVTSISLVLRAILKLHEEWEK